MASFPSIRSALCCPIHLHSTYSTLSTVRVTIVKPSTSQTSRSGRDSCRASRSLSCLPRSTRPSRSSFKGRIRDLIVTIRCHQSLMRISTLALPAPIASENEARTRQLKRCLSFGTSKSRRESREGRTRSCPETTKCRFSEVWAIRTLRSFCLSKATVLGTCSTATRRTCHPSSANRPLASLSTTTLPCTTKEHMVAEQKRSPTRSIRTSKNEPAVTECRSQSTSNLSST